MSQDVATALALYIDNLRVEELTPVAPKKKPLHFAVASDSQGLGTLSGDVERPCREFFEMAQRSLQAKNHFTAKPNPGYKVDKWTLNGATLPAEEFSSPTTYNYTTTGEETTTSTLCEAGFCGTIRINRKWRNRGVCKRKSDYFGRGSPLFGESDLVAKPSENYVLKSVVQKWHISKPSGRYLPAYYHRAYNY